MISVVIIEKNESSTIRRNLDTLLNQSFKDFEIIIVDGSSTDGTQEIIRTEYEKYLKAGKIKFICEPGLGFAHARNVGINNSSGEIIAFTGGNEIADTYWLERLNESFLPSVGGVYGKMMVMPDKSGNLLKQFCAFKREKEFSKPSGTTFLGRGTNMAFRKQVFDEVGLFDESLCDADDSEFASRVVKQWSIVYNPLAIVMHQKGEWQSWRTLLKYFWLPLRGHAQAVLKHGLTYYWKTTLLYAALAFYMCTLATFLVLDNVFLFTLSLLATFLGLLFIVIKDAIQYSKKIALFGLIIYPIQILVGSTAMFFGLITSIKKKSVKLT